jgi:hypothetical protein
MLGVRALEEREILILLLGHCDILANPWVTPQDRSGV